jgi:hypothetical protein
MMVSLRDWNIISFCTYLNAAMHKSEATEFCRIAPKISGSSVWNLLLVTRILR